MQHEDGIPARLGVLEMWHVLSSSFRYGPYRRFGVITLLRSSSYEWPVTDNAIQARVLTYKEIYMRYLSAGRTIRGVGPPVILCVW